MLCWEILETVSEELGWGSEPTSEIPGRWGAQRWEAGLARTKPLVQSFGTREEDRNGRGVDEACMQVTEPN